MASHTPPRTVLGTVVCLPVHDLEVASRFYRRVFSLDELPSDEDMATVELPNLSLFLITEKAFDSYSQKAGRGVAFPHADSSVILSCAIESKEGLDEMLDDVAACGGTVAQPAADDAEMGLYIGYFLDPDGHHWELAYSGANR